MLEIWSYRRTVRWVPDGQDRSAGEAMQFCSWAGLAVGQKTGAHDGVVAGVM